MKPIVINLDYIEAVIYAILIAAGYFLASITEV